MHRLVFERGEDRLPVGHRGMLASGHVELGALHRRHDLVVGSPRVVEDRGARRPARVGAAARHGLLLAVRIDAAGEQRLEAFVDAGAAQPPLQKRDDAERRQVSFIEHDGIAQRDRPREVHVRIDEIEQRARTPAVPAVPVHEGLARREGRDGDRHQATRRFRASAFRFFAATGPGTSLSFPLRALEAGAEARHEIDDLGLLGRLALLQPRRLAFQLALDDAHQVVPVFVGVFLRLPFRAEALDQLLRHLQLGGANVAGLRKAELAEVGELVGKAHHRQHQRIADDFERGKMLRVAEDDLGDADLSRVADRFADERVGTVRAFAGLQVVRRLEVALVHLVRIDEVQDVHRLRLLQCRGLEIVLGEDDELALLVFVALDQIFPADRLALRTDRRARSARAIRLWRAAGETSAGDHASRCSSSTGMFTSPKAIAPFHIARRHSIPRR